MAFALQQHIMESVMILFGKPSTDNNPRPESKGGSQ